MSKIFLISDNDIQINPLFNTTGHNTIDTTTVDQRPSQLQVLYTSFPLLEGYPLKLAALKRFLKRTRDPSHQPTYIYNFRQFVSKYIDLILQTSAQSHVLVQCPQSSPEVYTKIMLSGAYSMVSTFKALVTLTYDIMLAKPLTDSQQFCLSNFANKDWVKPRWSFHDFFKDITDFKTV